MLFGRDIAYINSKVRDKAHSKSNAYSKSKFKALNYTCTPRKATQREGQAQMSTLLKVESQALLSLATVALLQPRWHYLFIVHDIR